MIRVTDRNDGLRSRRSMISFLYHFTMFSVWNEKRNLTLMVFFSEVAELTQEPSQNVKETI